MATHALPDAYNFASPNPSHCPIEHYNMIAGCVEICCVQLFSRCIRYTSPLVFISPSIQLLVVNALKHYDVQLRYKLYPGRLYRRRRP